MMSHHESERIMAHLMEAVNRSPLPERSKRHRRMSRKFLHIFENSEVDDDVKKVTHFVSYSRVPNGEKLLETKPLSSRGDIKKEILFENRIIQQMNLQADGDREGKSFNPELKEGGTRGTVMNPHLKEGSTTSTERPYLKEGSTTSTMLPGLKEGSTTSTMLPGLKEGSTTSTVRPGLKEGSTTGTVRPGVKEGSTTSTVHPGLKEGSTTSTTCPDLKEGNTTSTIVPGLIKEGSTTSTVRPGLKEGNTTSTIVPGLIKEGSTTSTVHPGLKEGSTTSTMHPGLKEGSTTSTVLNPHIKEGSSTSTVLSPDLKEGSTTSTVVNPDLKQGSTTGTVVNSDLKECSTTTTVESVFKGRRGRPPKPLIVRVPRRRVVLHINSQSKNVVNKTTAIKADLTTKKTTRGSQRSSYHKAEHLYEIEVSPESSEEKCSFVHTKVQETESNESIHSQPLSKDSASSADSLLGQGIQQTSVQSPRCNQPGCIPLGSMTLDVSSSFTSCYGGVVGSPMYTSSDDYFHQHQGLCNYKSDIITTEPSIVPSSGACTSYCHPDQLQCPVKSLCVSYQKDVLGSCWNRIESVKENHNTSDHQHGSLCNGECTFSNQSTLSLLVSVPLPKVNFHPNLTSEYVNMSECTDVSSLVKDGSSSDTHQVATTVIPIPSSQSEIVSRCSQPSSCSNQATSDTSSHAVIPSHANDSHSSITLSAPPSKDHTYCQINTERRVPNVNQSLEAFKESVLSPTTTPNVLESGNSGSPSNTELESTEILDSSGDISEEHVDNKNIQFSNEVHVSQLSPRPSREVAMLKRHEKAFLYDESIIDLLFEEDDSSQSSATQVDSHPSVQCPTKVTRKSPSKKGIDQGRTVADCVPNNEAPSPSRNLRQRKEFLRTLSSESTTSLLKDKHSMADKKSVTPPTKRAKMLKAEKVNSLKLTFRKLPQSGKQRGRCARYILKDSMHRCEHDDKGSGKTRGTNKRLILAPPPPRGKNYWKQAQAWLPRKIPGTKSAAYSMRKTAYQLKPWKVDKKWLDENNRWKWLGDSISQEKYKEKGKNITRQYFVGMRRGMRHTEDIYVRDCVLVFTGDSEQFPYIGRILSLWQDSNSDEMMFTCAWYHRPQDVLSAEIASFYGEKELFASSHQDDNPVASILNKCYVMGYNEFCRFRAQLIVHQARVGSHMSSQIVPMLDNQDFVKYHIPVMKSLEDVTHVYYCKTSLISARYSSNRLKFPQPVGSRRQVSGKKMMLLKSFRSQQNESNCP